MKQTKRSNLKKRKAQPQSQQNETPHYMTRAQAKRMKEKGTSRDLKHQALPEAQPFGILQDEKSESHSENNLHGSQTRSADRRPKRRILKRIRQESESSISKSQLPRHSFQVMEIDVGNHENFSQLTPCLLDRAFIEEDSLSDESECYSLIQKNQKLMSGFQEGSEPRLLKFKRIKNEGDVFSQIQNVNLFKLKPHLFFVIFGYLGVLQSNALIPGVCQKMNKMMHWYKTVAKEITIEVIDPRLYQIREISSASMQSHKIQIQEIYLQQYYRILSSYSNVSHIRLEKYRHQKVPANFATVLKAFPRPALIKSLKMDDAYELDQSDNEDYELQQQIPAFMNNFPNWRFNRPRRAEVLEINGKEPKFETLVKLFPNLEELKITPGDLMYFGNGVNPFMYMLEYYTALVEKEAKEEESKLEANNLEQFKEEMNHEDPLSISGFRSIQSRDDLRHRQLMGSLSLSRIEDTKDTTAEHCIKHFSLILSGSNVSSEAVPPLLKSLFKYLSAQRTLETFEFRLGGRRNMGMAALDNEMYNYKIGSQLRRLHLEVDFLFDVRKSAEHFISALNHLKELEYLSVSRALHDTAPKYFHFMLRAKGHKLKEFHLLSTLNSEESDRFLVPGQETVLELYDIVLTKLIHLEALTIPLPFEAKITQLSGEANEERKEQGNEKQADLHQKEPLIFIYLERLFTQTSIKSLNLDLSNNLPEEVLSEKLRPLIFKYLFDLEGAKRTKVRKVNGIDVFDIIHRDFQILDMRRILYHMPKSYQSTLSLGKLTLMVLQQITKRSHDTLRFMKILDLNEKAECNCTLGSSSSYLVNRVNDPALFQEELFLKIFEDSENIDSFTNYSLTSDLLKFKYFSKYLSTSLRVPTREVNLGYVKGEEPPSSRKMLLNFGKRITNGTQHNVKAKLMRNGNIKMTIDRMNTLYSLKELFANEENPEEAVAKFKEYVRQCFENQADQHSYSNNRRNNSASRRSTSRKSKVREYSVSHKSQTKIEMLHELNDNYVILPRKAIISSKIAQYRLNCFGFSQNGELDKIYIPFLKYNEYIEAVCLDSDKLNPQHRYIQIAFENKKSIKKLHYKGSLEQSQDQERTFESLAKMISTWEDLETLAIVKTSLSQNCQLCFKNIVTQHCNLKQLFIQACEMQTDFYSNSHFLFDILRQIPHLEVLGLDVSFSGRLKFEPSKEPFGLKKLREFSCKLKSQTERNIDALNVVITMTKQCQNLEIFSAQFSTRQNFMIENDDVQIVDSICDIILKNKSLRCFFLDIDITDDVSIQFAKTALKAIKENQDFKFFCSINCNNIRRFYKLQTQVNRSSRALLNERGVPLSLYEHMDLTNIENQKEFPYRYIIPFLMLVALDLPALATPFPVHKTLRYDFKELKNLYKYSNTEVILSFRKKSRQPDTIKEPLPLFLGVVVPKMEPSVLKLEGIQSGFGRLSFAILKHISGCLVHLRELSFVGTKFESCCTIPGEIISKNLKLEVINLRSTNFLKTVIDEFLLALEDAMVLKQLDLGDLQINNEFSQYRKLMSALGKNQSIRTLTLPSARQLEEWYEENTSTQRLNITVKEKEFIKEIFHNSTSLFENWHFTHSFGAQRNQTRSIRGFSDLPTLVRQEMIPAFFSHVRGRNLQAQEHSHFNFQGNPLLYEFRREVSDERRSVGRTNLDVQAEPEILEEEKKEPPKPQKEEQHQKCRNFLHKVAREGRHNQLRSITLMQEDGSRVLYDLKKILKNVSHQGEVSSSKEGRNKNLVFKPQYYLLRSQEKSKDNNIVPVSEHLIEFLLRCYLSLDDQKWQVTRFGFEKFQFEGMKELLFEFVAVFGEKKQIQQLVLDSCKLENITDFTFLKRASARAQKVNLRNNILSSEQTASIIQQIGENPGLKSIVIGTNRKKVLTSEVVKEALEKCNRGYTLSKKQEILFE